MEKETFKNKSDDELKSLLMERRNSLRDFRFKLAKGKAKNMKAGLGLRKDIARILTEVDSRNKNDNGGKKEN